MSSESGQNSTDNGQTQYPSDQNESGRDPRVYGGSGFNQQVPSGPNAGSSNAVENGDEGGFVDTEMKRRFYEKGLAGCGHPRKGWTEPAHLKKQP